jgi:hypothetical protein
MKAAIWHLPVKMVFTTLGGLATGILLVLMAPATLGPALSAWDAAFPVLEPIAAEVIEREPDAVVIGLVAKKTKGEECRLIRIYGYGVDASGVLSLATVRRPDGSPQMGITHGPGVHDFGLWRVRPVDRDAVLVQVYVEHQCLGRVIRSKMAEVPL